MTHKLSTRFESRILSSTKASGMEVSEMVQELWSGYGRILRISLSGGTCGSVVVKQVKMPRGELHPRGWNSKFAHDRKVKSYQVESAWYRDWSHRCGLDCRVPKLLGFDREGDEVMLILEDLDASGYPGRRTSLTQIEMEGCLRWLASFHATFMGERPEGLWETGSYWHLATRQEELEALDDPELKGAAEVIDRRLSEARYQTLIHGDAKLANFCFSESGEQLAAVDFQYVGGGCGMKDLCYFLGSCLDEEACEAQEDALLGFYFKALRAALMHRSSDLNGDAIEEEWRELYPWAWTDFHRFLKGWSPGHWKINSYSERLAHQIVSRLR